ncbi:MAG: hypothetical protein ACYTGZ_12325 [Planctomycetota bacterium]|jgi:hypothetical protein
MVKSIFELFREEVADLGGRVTEHVLGERRLFARSVLPMQVNVVARDSVNPGVALRCSNEEIEVRPFVFRKICSNGAIRAQSADGALLHSGCDPLDIRLAIRAAASEESFVAFVGGMRSSIGRTPDFEHLLMGLRGTDPELLLDLLEGLRHGRMPDLYQLANAITARARDTADPEVKWRREALGAAVFARLHARVDAVGC